MVVEEGVMCKAQAHPSVPSVKGEAQAAEYVFLCGLPNKH